MVICQAPLSMGFSRQEYCSGLPFSFSRGSSHMGIEPTSPALAGRFNSILIYTVHWAQLLSHVQLFAIPWTVAHQAPLSMGFPRQKYWSGLSFPSPGFHMTQNQTHVSCTGRRRIDLFIRKAVSGLEGQSRSCFKVLNKFQQYLQMRRQAEV